MKFKWVRAGLTVKKRRLSKYLNEVKEQGMGVSRGKTFQAKGTSTKAMKQEYAMLRITYKETS